MMATQVLAVGPCVETLLFSGSQRLNLIMFSGTKSEMLRPNLMEQKTSDRKLFFSDKKISYLKPFDCSGGSGPFLAATNKSSFDVKNVK